MQKLFLVFLLLIPVGLLAQKQGKERADSVLAVLNADANRNNDSFKANLLSELARIYVAIAPDEGIAYGLRSIKVAGKVNMRQCAGYANLQIGRSYNRKANYPEALQYYMNALKIFDNLHNKGYSAQCLNGMGSVYIRLNNYEKAIGCFTNALQLGIETGNKKECMADNSNLEVVYEQQGNLAKAIDYALAAKKIAVETGDKPNEITISLNIGNIYSTQKNYSKAMDTYAGVLKENEKLGDTGIWAACYGSMGEAMITLVTDSTTHDPLIKNGKSANLHKANEYLAKAISYAQKMKDRQSIMEYSGYLASSYSLLGDYKTAYGHYQEYVALKDSLFSSDNNVKIGNLETKREADLKQEQVEINRLQKNKERNEFVFFVIGICLLLTVIILIFNYYRKQKQANSKLETTNKQLAEEKIRSDELTNSLQESVTQKDELAVSLQESLVQKEELATQLTISSNMKSRFLANISHELRTPVTLLTGMLELMKDESGEWGAESDGKRAGSGAGNGERGAKSGERLEVAYNNSRKLQYMIEEILDLSRLEHKEPELNAETKEIAPLLRRMVYAFETFIEKSHLSLEFKEENTHGIHISVDENKLEKIVNNLVYNAVKFNRKGGWIRVAVNLTDDKHELVFTVSNTGKGITAADLPHIFERFYQGDTATAKAEGMGIGLSLVKEFTLLMGGEVMASSTEGESTAFTLRFPVMEKTDAMDDAGPEVLQPPVEVWAHFRQRQTVLVVEDNAEMRYYLREILGQKVNLAEAGNGKEALQWLEGNKADLIISDIMMPEMDGREFISLLKSSEQYKKIPVITLTALADAESQHSMLRMGIDDYIVKPFNATELSIRVYNLLHNLEERKEFNRQPAEPEDVPADSKEAEEFRDKITGYVLARIKNTNVSVYDLAYELHLSERQLYRLAKGLTGCTPAQLIKEVRLQKAYELLLSGQINKIEDVANRVGFETPAWFSKQFLERFGKRPTEFL